MDTLQRSWIWAPGFIDEPHWTSFGIDREDTIDSPASSGQLVTFTKTIALPRVPTKATLLCSADTRYKLLVNSTRVAVGPTRSCDKIWYYDTLDLASQLHEGVNKLEFIVWRAYPRVVAAIPFERTQYPGLTAMIQVETPGTPPIHAQTDLDWGATIIANLRFPTDSRGDGFLHIHERAGECADRCLQTTRSTPYRFPRSSKVQGELSPWRLQPRLPLFHVETPVAVSTVRRVRSSTSQAEWEAFLSGHSTLRLGAKTTHRLEVQADCHSTAFLTWTFKLPIAQKARLKITYAESYERPPLNDYTHRNKGDRLDSTNGYLEGLVTDYHDEVALAHLPVVDGMVVYEPFWFRTFRFLVVEVDTGDAELLVHSFKATQVNYPVNPRNNLWSEPSNPSHEKMWEVSVRTLRNCVFDGLSDCPLYEQLQYTQDNFTTALFLYLLSGDQHLARQSIIGFAASWDPVSGLLESRFPSHYHQIIGGYSLFWILQVHSHVLYTGEVDFSRPLLPLVDSILSFFQSHVDQRGLVCNIPREYWSYVDWAKEWVSTLDVDPTDYSHPDGGTPYPGRATNTHTIISLLYSFVLRKALQLAKWLGRPGYGEDYLQRAKAIDLSVKRHCFDGVYFADTTIDALSGREGYDYSQHVQVFAALNGLYNEPSSTQKALRDAFTPVDHLPFPKPGFVKMSYAYRFWACRAFALHGLYEEMWPIMWTSWHVMLDNNLSTWEEDDVRHRSDCHAWASLPLFEFPSEVGGLQPLEPGWDKIAWNPRLKLSGGFCVTVEFGNDQRGTVVWNAESVRATLTLSHERHVVSGGIDHGVVKRIEYVDGKYVAE